MHNRTIKVKTNFYQFEAREFDINFHEFLKCNYFTDASLMALVSTLLTEGSARIGAPYGVYEIELVKETH